MQYREKGATNWRLKCGIYQYIFTTGLCMNPESLWPMEIRHGGAETQFLSTNGKNTLIFLKNN